MHRCWQSLVERGAIFSIPRAQRVMADADIIAARTMRTEDDGQDAQRAKNSRMECHVCSKRLAGLKMVVATCTKGN